MFAGLTFGLAFLCLQLGLLIALLRYRLYDAEVVISRSANVALITLGVAAVFAGDRRRPEADRLQLLRQHRQRRPGHLRRRAFDGPGQPDPGADQRWSEKRFQRNLVILRDDLPDSVRDMRETGNLGEMLDEILARIIKGVMTTHVAAIIDQGVFRTRGISKEKVEEWRDQTPTGTTRTTFASVRTSSSRSACRSCPGEAEQPLGYLLVGPRPDGSIPSRDEQKALKEVPESIARAIRTVIKREATSGGSNR